MHTCIDFHGRAPAAARPDMWADLVEGETRDGFGFILKGRVNDVGYQSIAVPAASRPTTRRSASSAPGVARRRRAGDRPCAMPASSSARMSTASGRGARAMGAVEMIDRLRFSPVRHGASISMPRARCMTSARACATPTWRAPCGASPSTAPKSSIAASRRDDRRRHGAPWRAFDARRSAGLPHDARAPLWGTYRGLAHRHRPAAGRRRHAARDAATSWRISTSPRSATTRPTTSASSPRR